MVVDLIEIESEDGRRHAVRADLIRAMKSLRSNDDGAPIVLVIFGEDHRDRLYTRESYATLKDRIDDAIAVARMSHTEAA